MRILEHSRGEDHFFMLSMDSWLWKIVVIGAIIAMRQFVRLLTAPAPPGENSPASESSNFVAPNDFTRQNVAQMDQNARGLLEVMDAIAMAFALVFFVIQPFLLQAFYIPSGSMENTLQWRPTGDRLLVSKWIYKIRGPRFGEVVVFQPPVKARVRSGDDYIKRCIGAPGDVIFARNRRYFRRARGTSKTLEIREPYVKWSDNLSLQGYDMKIVGGKVYSREYSKSGFSGTDDAGLWQEEGAVGQDSSGVTFPPVENQGAIEAAEPEAIPDEMFLVLGDHRNDSYDGHAWGLVPRANFVGKAMCIFWPPSRINTLDRISENGRTNAADSAVPNRSARISSTRTLGARLQ